MVGCGAVDGVDDAWRACSSHFVAMLVSLNFGMCRVCDSRLGPAHAREDYQRDGLELSSFDATDSGHKRSELE